MQKPLMREILKNCIPTVLSLTMVGLYGVIDGLFVGNATGDTGLAAINIAWPLIACINAIGITIGSSGSVLMSFEKGSGDTEKSKEIFCVTISTIIVLALLATVALLPVYSYILKWLGAEGEVYNEAARYTQTVILGCVFQALGTGIVPILRNKDKSFVAMVCMAVGTGINIVVNYILIFEFRLGIQGAAMATIFAQLIVAVLGGITLLKEEKFRFLLKVREVIRIIKVGFATFGISIAPSIVLMFTNWQCLKYGDAAAVASYAVISYITFPAQSMLTGIGEGVQPLMSMCVGANQNQKLLDIKKIARVMLLAFSLLLTILVVSLSGSLGKWFGLSSDADTFFQTGILIYALSFTVVGFVKFNVSYLNSTLQTSRAILLTYTESLAVTPIFIFILPLFWGVSGIWLSFPLTAITQIIVYTVITRRRKKLYDGNT